MQLADDTTSTAMIREALHFSRNSLEASSSVFFWIGGPEAHHRG